jgi:Zinc-finger associated domain (zf-AD)
MITEISGIEITSEDTATQIVCEKCLNSLSSACKLKEQCIESDKILKTTNAAKNSNAASNFVKVESLLDDIEDYEDIEMLNEDEEDDFNGK